MSHRSAACDLGDFNEAVAVASRAGVPWDRIGEAVGTSGEVARQEFRTEAEKEMRVTTDH